MKKLGTLTAVAFIFGLLLIAGSWAQQEMGSQPQNHQSATESPAQQEEMESPAATESPAQQEEMAEGQEAEAPAEGQEAKILKASDLIGYTVTDPVGEELGKIVDVVIDPQEGRVAYAAMSYGGIWGMGDKLFAIPWDAMAVKPDEKIVLVSVDKEKLEEAPGFDENNWPETATLDTGAREQYGQKSPEAGRSS